MCVCRDMTPVENRTGVWIVQHPRERFHPIGTARIATCGLANVRCATAFRNFSDWPAVPSEAMLLFPSPDALELSAIEPGDRPPHLLVVDGTWANAAALIRDQPWLGRFRRCRIEPTEPGNYRIRKEPAARCLSTIEAIVQALMVLEPETEGLERLLASFDSMIDRQIEVMEVRRARNPRRSRRRSELSGLPRVITGHGDLVLVHGESISTSGAALAHHRELVQWAAVRVSTGESFDRLARPEVRFPTATHLQHMGIDATTLGEAADIESMRRDWNVFLRPGDVVAALHQSVLDVGAAWLGSFGAPVALKSAYCNWRRARSVAEQTASQDDLGLSELNIRGRAGAQLAQTLAWLKPLLT